MVVFEALDMMEKAVRNYASVAKAPFHTVAVDELSSAAIHHLGIVGSAVEQVQALMQVAVLEEPQQGLVWDEWGNPVEWMQTRSLTLFFPCQLLKEQQ